MERRNGYLLLCIFNILSIKQIISEKKLEILKATPLEEFEKSLDTIETSSELKDLKKKAEDDSYKQLLAKVTISSILLIIVVYSFFNRTKRKRKTLCR